MVCRLSFWSLADSYLPGNGITKSAWPCSKATMPPLE